ncbi:MAG: thymidine kinase [Mycoplasmataceae bacterium]|nr:thymidine kinase [Mycoplasmataceae bacterium]
MMKKSNVFKSMNENWIQVITGPMFSGKTTELLSFIERYSYAGINALGVMNEIDTRSNDDFIHSRNGHKLKAIKVKKSIDILDYVIKNELKNKIQIIAIDEVQFFDSEIVDVIKKLAKMKFIVICSGLDLDYNGNTFGQMPKLLAIADNVIKLTAICSVCGGAATKTYLKNHKKTKNTNTNPIVIADANMFEARCNKHFVYKTK